MEKFYRDKSKLFECNLSIEGANINNTQARLVLQFDNDDNLLFYGKINENGKCSINVPPLKNNYNNKGKVLLEVIADSTYFESWDDDFELETSKKVVVERIENSITNTSSKPKVTLINESNKIKEFSEYLSKNNITIYNIHENRTLLHKLLLKYTKSNNKKIDEVKYIMENITNCINYLK